MSDLLQVLPIYLFMLIPVWIPLITVTVGALYDVITAQSRRATPQRRVAQQPQALAARAINPAGPRVHAAETAA